MSLTVSAKLIFIGILYFLTFLQLGNGPCAMTVKLDSLGMKEIRKCLQGMEEVVICWRKVHKS